MNERENTEGTDKFEVVSLNIMKVYMRTALFWVLTQREVVISCRSFGYLAIFILTLEDGTGKLFRNVGSELPLLDAS